MKVYLLMRPDFGGCCEELEWEEVDGVFATPEAAMATMPERKAGRREVHGWLNIEGEWRYTRTDAKHPETYGAEYRIVPWEVVG